MTWVDVAVLLAAFGGMEFMAWFTHKYIMHGIGWYFHRDHHRPNSGFFEKNDVFFTIFAAPSILLIILGVNDGADWKLYAGLGIALYGAVYFLVHEVFIHRRFSWFKHTDNAYLRAIRKAHKVHHKHLDKEDGECFGMLIVPWKYYREALRARRAAKATS